jgi:hypothetical protein
MLFGHVETCKPAKLIRTNSHRFRDCTAYTINSNTASLMVHQATNLLLIVPRYGHMTFC